MTQIVYFWIERYNNIEKSGFNFGSEYIFDYNHNTKEITTTKNIEFIPNFYNRSDNDTRISNISAIVGENASGKSSLLAALREVLTKERVDFQYLLITQNNNREKKINSNLKDKLIIKNHNQNLKYRIDSTLTNFQVIIYSPSYDFSYNENESTTYGYINISSDYLLFTDKANSTDNRYYSHKIAEIERQIIYQKNKKYQYINPKVTTPNSVSLILNDNNKYIKENKDNIEIGGTTTDDFNKLNIQQNFKKNLSNLLKGSIYYGLNINEKQKMKFRIINCILINLCKIIELKNVAYNWNNTTNRIKQKDNTKIMKDTITNEISLYNLNNTFEIFCKNINFDSKLLIELKNSLFRLIDNIEQSSIHFDTFSAEINTNDIDTFFEVYNNYLSHFGYNFKFIDFEWRNMSTGEKALLNLSSRMFHAKTIYKRSSVKKDFLILIDEGELGFHLQWQKEYVNTLIHVLPKIFKWNDFKPNIQIIFTTHSPVSLSDIPKTNVIFLSDGNVLNETNKTFAANIHLIMKQSFFMHESFIGKFAENKINSIINEIRNNKSIKKEKKLYLEKVINIIDEPIIKTQLLQLLHGKESEKERLRREIQEKEERLKELEHD